MTKNNFFISAIRLCTTVLIVVFLSTMNTACHTHQLTTRHLKEGEYLLKKNKVVLEGGKDVDKADLSLYIRQKPNTSWLFGTWKIGLQWKNLWYKEGKGKERAAVILDSAAVVRSAKQMKIYLQNLGYYNATIDTTIRRTRILGVKKWETKKAIVEYHVKTGSAYFIDSTAVYISDSSLLKLYRSTQQYSHVKTGKQLKIAQLQQERERLAKLYQNHGYFDFTENFIHFDVDTNGGDYKTTLITKLKPPNNEDRKHIKYFIRDIYIQTDFDAYDDSTAVQDTILFKNKVYFVSKGKSRFKPSPLYRSIFLKTGEEYELAAYNATYKQLLNLQMFSLLDVDFEKVDVAKGGTTQNLDVYIRMTPAKKMAISVEGMATFREGFGGNGQIAFSSKNPFKGSEILEFSIAGGVENLKSNTSDDRILGANVGPRLSIQFPSFLFFPKLNGSLAKTAFPKSKVSASYNYQKRLDFTRYLSNLYLKYEWNEGKYKKHELNVLDFSFSYLAKSSTILSNLSSLQPSEKFRFEDNISAGIRYRFTFNNQHNSAVKHPVYLIANGSLIGASSWLTKALGVEKRDQNDAINVFGIRYSNYLKVDVDFRYYYHFNKKHLLVFRSFSGAGLPLDQYGVIPYEQLYFAGGANSVRGWQQRTLGPGIYFDEANFYDRLGEVKIEGNLEYRFPITSIIKGGLFVDAGNVWTLKNEQISANFDEKLFFKQLAISPGLGVRLDFDFFLFRIDMAIPVKKPHISGWSTDSELNPNWNFGIGYPF